MKFNLKNVKTWNSRNGYGFCGTLVINNIDVCTMIDPGDGSQPRFEVLNKELFSKWEAGVKQIGEIFIPDYGCSVVVDNGLFIDLLHSALINKTDFNLLTA